MSPYCERELDLAEDALFAHLLRCEDCMGDFCVEQERLTKIRDELEREFICSHHRTPLRHSRSL